MVTIESKFDAKTYKAYYMYDTFLVNKKCALLYVGEAIFAALAVFGLLKGQMNIFYPMLALIVLFPAIFYFRARALMKANLRIANLEKEPISVKFDLNDRKIVTLNKNTARHHTYKWEEVVRAKRNGIYRYLYVNKVQAVVLNTEHITEGTLAELDRLIAEGMKREKKKADLPKA